MTAFHPRDHLTEVKTASLIDAMGRTLQQRAYILDLVTPTPGKILFGQALTISFLPYRADLYNPKRNFGCLFYESIGDDPKNRVLVLATGGHPDTSVGGGTKLSRLQNHGLAGVLTDGRIRDFDELRNFDFVTFCRGEAVHWGGDTIMPFAANVPVSMGGITVVPGDYVFADDSGAAIIPAAVVGTVFEEALRVQDEDERSIERIRKEIPEEVVRNGGSEEKP